MIPTFRHTPFVDRCRCVTRRSTVRALEGCLPGMRVQTTDQHGLDPQWVEATAFAWLAHYRLEGRPRCRPLYDTRPDVRARARKTTSPVSNPTRRNTVEATSVIHPRPLRPCFE
ncbi:MAG: anhydro-N-acetylmuramic acid kinase [bacterium]